MRLLRGAYRGYLVIVGSILLLALIVDTRYAVPFLSMLIGAGLVTIIIHEVGHAVAATLVGYRVVRIVSGTGPRLFGCRIGSTEVELRLVPGGGHTLSSARHPTDNRGARWREFLTVAGGPAASLALVLLVARVWPVPVTLSRAGTSDQLTMVAMIERLGWWVLVTNLIPWSPQVDGARMLALLRADDEGVAEMAALRGTATAMHHFERGNLDEAIAASAEYGDNTAAACIHATALSRAGRFAEARAVLVPLLDQPMPPERQCIVANNLAWVDVQLDDPALLAEAEQWSAAALRLAVAPAPALASTRAHVLAALGRHEEAAQRFAEALAGPLDDESRAEVLAGRARLRLDRGDALGAREDADAAARLAPGSAVVAKARWRVDRASLGIVAGQIVAEGGGWQLAPALRGPAGRATVAGAARALDQLGDRASVEPEVFLAAADSEMGSAGFVATLRVLVGLRGEPLVDPFDELIA
ncbi:MAG: M50 family metallopeptidase [Acidimicrobiia bacterium]|nr:M50 family metallopeptidase [Acidimicrobiia bacterium]